METQGNRQDLKAKFEALCDEQETLYKPQFEIVFQALFEIDDEQRALFSPVWNMACKLPDKADEGKIRQALKQAGFGSDEAFCTAFLRYANIVVEGKKIQQAGAIQDLKEQTPPTPRAYAQQVQGWKFKPMTILAPVAFHGLIIQTVFECANITDIPTESIDELLDELANREAFFVRCSLTPYIEELRKYRVILDKDSFFDRERTRLLFGALKRATDSLKANTNKPETAKAEIADIIKGFDGVTVWGLFFQILTLQGLCGLFERLEINKGDTGYNEAQSVYDWLCNLLIEKETFFCCLPYGGNDLKRLEPFCAYLMSTEIGRFVQAGLFGSDEQSQQETPPTAQPLNDEQSRPAQPDIMTDGAKKYFAKAIQAGFMEQTGNGYKWTFGGRKGAKAALCYFIMKVYSPDVRNSKMIHYKALEKLFDEKRLDSAYTATFNVKKPQQWRGEIDSLFND